ncbi:MAG: BTAD domain-containing putative transcriptional regulator [Pseudomonadota bacterium]
MAIFKLLGGFELVDPPVEGFRMPSKKSEAMMSYLLLQKGKSQLRSEIASLLWSRSAQEQAFGSLRQECLKLKKHLAILDLSLEIDNRQICLSLDGVEVDVIRFETLLADGDMVSAAEAFALYRGEFLKGRPTPDPVYTEWFNRQRERIDQLAIAGFQPYAEHLVDSSEPIKAEQVARVMAAIDPFSERPVYWLMRALADQSNSGSAADHYRKYVDRMQSDFGLSPGRELTDLYEAISGKKSAGSRSDSSVSGNQHLPKIAVMPFGFSGDGSAGDVLADGLSRDLTTALGRFRNFVVMAANSSQQFKMRQASRESLWEDFGIRYIVEGNIQAAGNRIRVTVELIDAREGVQLWSEQYDRDGKEIFGLQDAIAYTVVNSIDRRILQLAHYIISRNPTRAMGAYEMMVEARLRLEATSQADIKKSIELCKAAIELDDQYSQVYALLSFAQIAFAQNGWTSDPVGMFKDAQQNSIRAVNLDARNHIAHIALGMTSLFLHDHARARSSLQRAVDLNPGSADGKAFYALILCYCGKSEQALEVMEDAMNANPLHPNWYKQFAARIHYVNEDYNGTLAQLEALDALSPDYTTGLSLKAVALAALGRKPEAAEQVRLIQKSSPGFNLKTAAVSAPYQSTSDLERYLNQLRSAGLPA